MKLIFCSHKDGALFAAVLRLAMDAGATIADDTPDPLKAGFGQAPFTLAPGVAVADQLPIAPGANTSTTAPGGLALVPTPGSAAGAPSVPAAPSNPAGGAVELDIHGIPWDSRIHAGTASKNADGAWKRKKGVGDVFYNDTAAELRRVMAIPAPVVAPPPPVDAAPLASSAPVAPPAPPMMPPAPPAPPVVPPGPAPSVPASVAPPVAPAPLTTAPAATDNIPAAPGPVLNTEPKTFPELMSLATGLLQAGRIQQAELISACQASGVPNLPSLAPRPDLIPGVAVTIMALAKPAA